MLVGGWPIARAALVALRRRTLDMNVLMALAAIGAVGIGAWAEGAWVLVLFAVGTTLEALALDHTRGAVAALADLVPLQARMVDADGERLVAVEDVPVGAIIVVHPGERVPLDGVVEAGFSSVDEAAITGESAPVDKAPGGRLFAGSLNQQGALHVRTTEDAAGSTLNRMVELVEQAQASRAPSERFVDRFARVYTPLTFVAAVLVAVVPIALGADASTWIYRALALLIVACPCSLVISVPVAVVSALGAAARGGVLIKGGQALEDLARVSVVCVDKTGTLTRGLPVLVEVRPVEGLSEREALRLMATVERRSEHPLAAAIRRAAADADLEVGEPSRFLALPGRGVEALVDGRALWAGGPLLTAERTGADPPPPVAELEQGGHTVLALGRGDRVLAAFAIADEPRPEAGPAVSRLRADGLAVQMLTGDNEAVAMRVARTVGVETVHAGLLPEQKLRLVEDARTQGVVAMVGDGVNDAPALAAADVGVAMGAAGSAVALEAADVALMSDDLRRLPETVLLARRALRTMRQNVIASLAVKAVFVALAPFGLVTLWLAVAADMGMSLLVTANALRLLRGLRPCV